MERHLLSIFPTPFESGVPFHKVVPPFFGSVLGDTFDLMSQLVKVKDSPCVIFLGEIDAITEEKRLFSYAIKKYIEKIGNIVIATAVRTDKLHPSLLESETSLQINMPRPDTADREAILQVLADQSPINTGVDLSELAKVTERFGMLGRSDSTSWYIQLSVSFVVDSVDTWTWIVKPMGKHFFLLLRLFSLMFLFCYL